MLSLTNKKHCCAAGLQGTGRRLRYFMSWLLPGTLLVLVPKCPLCIVAYVALGTGIGLSVPMAAGIRIFLIIACVGSLAYLSVRLLRRIAKRGY